MIFNTIKCLLGRHQWKFEIRVGYYGPSREEIKYRVRKCEHCGRVEDMDEPSAWYESIAHKEVA